MLCHLSRTTAVTIDLYVFVAVRFRQIVYVNVCVDPRSNSTKDSTHDCTV